MLKKILNGLGAVLVLVVSLAIATYVATGPSRPDSASSSAEWLQAGPHRVASADFTFVDSSRSTNENRGFPSKPERTLPTTIWYPQGLDGQLPLIIHSHGIVSNGAEMPYVAEAMASHGYIVAAADYPLTSGSTPGGANGDDVVNQPADVSFLIDSVLNLRADEKPFVGEVDDSRIGLSGYSLGGLTTYLTTYHPRWRDPRVAAAVAIAGPSAIFSASFFGTTDVPVLAIAGTADALIEYARNAADLDARAPDVSVITIEGGSHLGFVGVSDPTFRFMDNPDTLGCSAVMAVLGDDPNAVFRTMGSVTEGIDPNRDLPGICDYGYDETTHPGRQQIITQLAAVSFFESVFSADGDRRAAARRQLTQALAVDFEEVAFTPAPRE